MNTAAISFLDVVSTLKSHTKKMILFFFAIFFLEAFMLMGFPISPNDTYEEAQVKTLIISAISWLQIACVVGLMLSMIRKTTIDAGFKFKAGSNLMSMLLSFLVSTLLFLLILMLGLSLVDNSALISMMEGKMNGDPSSLQGVMLVTILVFFIAALYFGTLLQQFIVSGMLKRAKKTSHTSYVNPFFAVFYAFGSIHKQWKFILTFIGLTLFKATNAFAISEGYFAVGAIISSIGTVLVSALIASLVIAGIKKIDAGA